MCAQGKREREEEWLCNKYEGRRRVLFGECRVFARIFAQRLSRRVLGEDMQISDGVFFRGGGELTNYDISRMYALRTVY